MSPVESARTNHSFGKNWDGQTTFKDTVLGYVNVPKTITNKIIDSKIFQRLHDVAQTGMEALYPSATHNRFCHSIGVYHLGKMAFENFRQNIKTQYRHELYNQVADTPEDAERIWDRWGILFQLACLLHDCGHSPLSHTLEFLYDVADHPGGDEVYSVESNAALLDFFGKDSNFAACFIRRKKKMQSPKACGAPHERMSACLLISKKYGYYNELYELLDSHLQYYQGKLPGTGQYDEAAFHSDLEFMVRAIIGCPYDGESTFWETDCKEKWNIIYQLRNCIIALLNGKIDVDNIDYSIRDATASGYKSVQVDYERLLKAHTAALAYRHENFTLRGEPFDFAVRLYKYTSTVDGKMHPVSMTISGSATLLVKWSGESGQEEHRGLKLMGNIIEEDESSSGKTVRVIHIEADSSAYIELEEGSLEIIPRDCDRDDGAQLYIRSDALWGSFTGMIFTGGKSDDNDKNAPVRKRVAETDIPPRIYSAYHKSALSVIQGALDAANFESLWIYSHHSTTYHNNFLSVYLLEKYADFCYDQNRKKTLQSITELSNLCGKRLQFGKCGTLEPVDPSLTELFERIRNGIAFLGLKGVQEDGPDGDPPAAQERLQQIAQSFPKELPDKMDIHGMELCKVLLHCFEILQGMLPLDTPDDRGRILYMLAQVANQMKLLIEQMGIGPSVLTVYENNTFQRLQKQLTEYKSVSRGLPVMRDILGMPTPKTVNGEHFFRSSDASLRSMYHRWAENISEPERTAYSELLDVIEQYESRHYLRPMWKSHAEFNFYVQGWKGDWFLPLPIPQSAEGADSKKSDDDENWSLIETLFCQNRISPTPSRKSANVLYTYFSDNTVHRYNDKLRSFWDACKKKFNLDTLVYVPQQIRHKELDCSKTYVVWKNRIVTLQDIGFQINQNSGRNYFYFYYRCAQRDGENAAPLDVAKFMDFLRDNLTELERNTLGTHPEAGEDVPEEGRKRGSDGNE